jgi:hypothetical protein
LSAQLLPTFADRECHVFNVTDPYGRNLSYLDRSRYFFFEVAPQFVLMRVSEPRTTTTTTTTKNNNNNNNSKKNVWITSEKSKYICDG